METVKDEEILKIVETLVDMFLWMQRKRRKLIRIIQTKIIGQQYRVINLRLNKTKSGMKSIIDMVISSKPTYTYCKTREIK